MKRMPRKRASKASRWTSLQSVSPLLEAPALHEVPGGRQAIGLVEDAFHERGQREHALGGLAVRRAELDVSLQTDFREERREMQVPVVERRALASRALGEEPAGRGSRSPR